jgi:hypothetical protein
MQFSGIIVSDMYEFSGPVMDAALHRLRQSTQPWLANLGSTKTPDLLDALDATVLSAREVPILGGARIDACRVYDILDQLRQSVVQDIQAHRKNAEAV